MSDSTEGRTDVSTISEEIREEITEEISSVAPEVINESDSLNLSIPDSETTSVSSEETIPSDGYILI